MSESQEILGQVEAIIVPIIIFTLENKMIGTLFMIIKSWTVILTILKDLFDNMYDLVDALTFDMRRITPEMWNVFELTYKLFKTDAIDFLEGNYFYLNVLVLQILTFWIS